MRPVKRLRGLNTALTALARSAEGAAAIEFGLIAPLLLVFLVGSIETGRAVWSYSTLQYAAEEAARFASVNAAATDAEVAQVARATSAGLNSESVGVVFVRAATPASVSVKLTYAFSPAFNLFPAITLEGKSKVPALN